MIISPFLPVVLALGGGHAQLHPANTNFYFEVPGVRAAIAAYENAPLSKFVEDPSIQGFVSKLMGVPPESVTYRNLVNQALDGLGESFPEVGVLLLDLVPDVESVSCSVSGLDLEGVAGLFADSQGQLSAGMRERLSEAQARLVMDFSNPETAIDAVAIIRDSLQAQAEAGAWLLVKHVEHSAGEPLDWSTHLYRETDPPLSLYIAQQGARMTVCLGVFSDPETAPKMLGKLSENPSYGAAGEHMGPDEGITILSSYSSLSGLHELPATLAWALDIPAAEIELLEVAMISLMPSGRIESRSRTRLIQGRFATDSIERSFDSAETPSLYSSEPVTKTSFVKAPADAVVVSASNLNREGLQQQLQYFLADLTGEEPEEVMEHLQGAHNFDPCGDLISSLGGGMVFYTLPFQGIGMPKMFVVLELDDSEAFARGMTGLAAYVREEVGENVAIQERPYRRRPFFSFTPGKDITELAMGTSATGMAAMLPAFITTSVSVGVLEDRAIFGLSSSFVKREMKRLLKEPKDGKHPIVVSADEFPSGVEGYGTTDWGALLGGLYDAVCGFLPLIEQGADLDLPFSLDELPSGDLFSQYFPQSVSWSRQTPAGLYHYTESSFGPEVGFLLGGGISAVFFLGTSAEPEELFMVEDQATAVVEADPLAATLTSLGSTKMCVQIYKAEHGHYPLALSNLSDPSENFPKGQTALHGIPQDGWGAVLRYELNSEGASYRLWSSGPDGVDAKGAGDDVILKEQG